MEAWKGWKTIGALTVTANFKFLVEEALVLTFPILHGLWENLFVLHCSHAQLTVYDVFVPFVLM